jgi:hypothetical protein
LCLLHNRRILDTYVNLSIHTAPDVRPLPYNKGGLVICTLNKNDTSLCVIVDDVAVHRPFAPANQIICRCRLSVTGARHQCPGEGLLHSSRGLRGIRGG